tara:strand:- start:689 stop:1093 length:405 start_codon:yes stop_codon:yes gene_type:complete
MSWSNEQKQKAVEIYQRICESEYQTDDERAENATAILEQVKDELGEDKTVNGVRRILGAAKVYIAQKPKAKAATASKSTGTKMSKADQIQALKDAVRDAVPEGTELDEAIFDKLTGKAAAHFTELFVLANQGGE